jgi:quercetin dioxygenase-like cupin family protein
MAKSRYLIRMTEKDDWIRSYDEGTQVVNDFILPIGHWEKNEMSDTIYHQGTEVPYHEHRKGFETFFVPRGKVECFVRGKHFFIGSGDILHLTPYTAHGFKFLEEGTIWRELFQEINMSQGIMNKNIVKNNYGGLYDNPDFIKSYRAAHNSITREPIKSWEDVDKKDMHEVRTRDFAYSTYRFDGITLRLKVGRWECNGIKELWHAVMDKGFTLEYADPYPEWELYYIAGGKIKFQILEEEFVASSDCLVHIPPYHRHEIEVLEDGSEMYDMGCAPLILSMLEDIASLKEAGPEKLTDAAFMKDFMHRYGCYLTRGYKK